VITVYIRDGCVFRRAHRHRRSHGRMVRLRERRSRSPMELTAFASLEGLRLEIEGTAGRVVYEDVIPTDWPPGKRRCAGAGVVRVARTHAVQLRDGVVKFPTDTVARKPGKPTATTCCRRYSPARSMHRRPSDWRRLKMARGRSWSRGGEPLDCGSSRMIRVATLLETEAQNP